MGLAVLYQVAVHVVHTAPGEGDRTAAGLGVDVPGDRGPQIDILRDDVPQELDLFHYDIGGGSIHAVDLFHGDGDFLHRYPMAQADGDGAFPKLPLGGVYPGRRGLVKGNFLHGAVLVFHLEGTLLRRAAYGGGDNGDFAHLLGLGEGNGDLAEGALPGGEAHLLAVVQKQVLYAGAVGDLDSSLGQLLGDGAEIKEAVGGKGSVVDLFRAFGRHVVVDQGQVHQAHLSIQVDVGWGVIGAVDGEQPVQVLLADGSVSVHIPQGKAAALRADVDMGSAVLYRVFLGGKGGEALSL